MGSVTSRKQWPPDPRKARRPRWVWELVLVDGKWTRRLVNKGASRDRDEQRRT